ncbi:MAG: STAS domain-containing protein [Mycobacterium sp.]
MTASIAPRMDRPTTLRFGGADVRPCARHLATVVSVRGDLTADNIAAVTDQVCRFVLPDTSFVLDLTELTAFTREAAAMLRAVEHTCAATEVEWALVTAPGTTETFDTALRDLLLPVVDSVADALHDFADTRTAQRSALLPLLQRTA